MVLGFDLVIQLRFGCCEAVYPLPIPTILHLQEMASCVPGRNGTQRAFDHLRSSCIDIHVLTCERFLGTTGSWQVLGSHGYMVSNTMSDSETLLSHGEQVYYGGRYNLD